MRAAVVRPRLALGLLGLVVVTLAFLGRDLDSRLTPTVLLIPGTESARASDLYSQEFGDGITIPVLLEGPERALERQGPELVRELRARPDFRVLSAWDRGPAGEALRPESDSALIVVAVDQEYSRAVEAGLEDVRREVGRAIEAPVTARVTGLAAIGQGVKNTSLEAVARAEKIAAPILVVVLLAVFRSVVAAAIPGLLGAAAVIASMGGLSLTTRFMDLDAISVSLASMMGLALGVDYSLLLVSRFREELQGGADARAAALTTVATAGRTVVFAAAVLGAAMVVALAIAPGDLLASAAVGVIIAVAVSVLLASAALPAILALLGTNIDRGWIGRRRDPRRRPPVVAGAIRVLRRPLVPALLVLGALLLLAAPAMGLRTGPPDVRMLPDGSPVREDFEAVADVMGAGWTAPFEVVVRTDEGAITRPSRLRAMRRWQRDVAEMRGVEGVVGPGAIAGELPDSEPLEDLEEVGDQLAQGRRQLERLEHGLGRAGEGVRELRAGLGEAAAGAGRLQEGGQAAASGAGQVREGLARAGEGAEQLAAGLAEARRGGTRLVRGADRVTRGARRLERELEGARSRLRAGLHPARELPKGLREGARDLERLREPAQRTEAELRKALKALDRMVVGKADPNYLEAYRATATALGAASGRNPTTGGRVEPGYDGLDASLARASDELGRAAAGAAELVGGMERLAGGLAELADGARELREGVGRLERGARRLRAGLAELASGAGSLAGGLDELRSGASRLDGGLGELAGGAGRLESGLGDGAARSAELEDGLESGERRVARFGDRLVRPDVSGLQRSARRSPGLFESGYFTLAALDGAETRDRAGAAFAVSLANGGQAGRILVVPETGPNEPETADLRDRLAERADDLAEDVGGEAAVGGAASFLEDYDRETSDRFPLLVLGIVLASYVVLVPVFRSLVLPALAIVLNLVTVGAAFGVLALLFQHGGPLADAGFLDAVSAAGVFCVLFGLSIDYQVFLITRMREGWDRTGDTIAAVAYGLERTAAVVTGAAAIMLGVFCAFAFTDVASIQQFGLGLALAVLIDATVVRLILLPAAMRALGRANWYLPRWLDRLLPRVAVD